MKKLLLALAIVPLLSCENPVYLEIIDCRWEVPKEGIFLSQAEVARCAGRDVQLILIW